MRLLKTLFLTGLMLAASSSAQTRYYGAVDVGSKGTKAALYSFVKEAEGRNPDVVFGKTINTKLVSSMKDGRFTEGGIAEATAAVKQVVEDLRAEAKKRNIAADPLYVVGSSGVAMGQNKGDLVAAVKAATGIDMDFVDARNEGYFGLLSSVPLSRRSSSMYLDIGSGNTKLGCLVGDSDLRSYKGTDIPFGSASGRNAGAKKNPNDIKAGIRQVMEEEVGPAYTKESMDTPCLRNRQRIYWSGGASWATATLMHPDRALDGYVIISKSDLEALLARLSDGTWNQRKLAFSFPKDMPLDRQNKIRARAEKDRDDVLNTFVAEDIFSGVSIMRKVLDVSNPSAILQFVRNGNFIYGYALEKYREDREAGNPSAGR